MRNAYLNVFIAFMSGVVLWFLSTYRSMNLAHFRFNMSIFSLAILNRLNLHVFV